MKWFTIFADMNSTLASNGRETWVDWLRVTACFLVMVVHSTEPFYLGGDGSLILTKSDAFWAALFDSSARACVPLFVVASSYLLFPLKYSTGEFFRRRVARLLVPFLIWTLVYALVWGEPVSNLKGLLLNFNYAAGHLWFVYMLVGLYLLMPLLSPWAEKAGKKEVLFFLAVCFFTTLIPFIRVDAAPEKTAYIFGVGGLPMPALFPLWGECSWNIFGTFYYLSGFVGYLLLGLYLKKFAGGWSRRKSLLTAIPSLIAGFAITFGGFLRRVLEDARDGFPIGGNESVAAEWETTWNYSSTGVVLMTVGWILLFRLCSSSGGFYRKVVLPVSKAGYGMYLCHMLLLAFFSSLFRNLWGIGTEGFFGVMTTPLQILLTAACSYLCTAASCVAVQRIPKAGKWIVG